MLDFKNYSYSFLLHLLFILGFYILSYFFVHQNKISTSHLSINSVSVGMIDEGALESLNQEAPGMAIPSAPKTTSPANSLPMAKTVPHSQAKTQDKTSFPLETAKNEEPYSWTQTKIAQRSDVGASSSTGTSPSTGTGASIGTSTAGTGKASGATGGGSVNEKYHYIKDILPMLSSLLHYPEELLEENIEGTSLVHFTINREGYITDAKIYKSSGKVEFDESSIDLFKRIKRYKKFPEHWTNNTESFILPVAYHIH